MLGLHGSGWLGDAAGRLNPFVNPFATTPKEPPKPPPIVQAPDPRPSDFSGDTGPHYVSNDAYTNEEMKAIASAAYSTSPTTGNSILDNTLLHKTRTLAFYAKPQSRTIIVGVRGTQDLSDAYSDVLLGLPFQSAFVNSPRVRESLDELREFQRKYPRPEYTYIGAGHSLGGAVIDVMLQQGLLSSARTYNPAQSALDVVGPQNTDAYEANHRVYNDHDWLYNMGNTLSQAAGMGTLADRGAADVRKDTTSGVNGYAAHNMGNEALAGGAIEPSARQYLRREKIASDPYHYKMVSKCHKRRKRKMMGEGLYDRLRMIASHY